MQFALDNVVSVIYDGSTDYNNSDSEMGVSLGRILQGITIILSFLLGSMLCMCIYSIY